MGAYIWNWLNYLQITLMQNRLSYSILLITKEGNPLLVRAIRGDQLNKQKPLCSWFLWLSNSCNTKQYRRASQSTLKTITRPKAIKEAFSYCLLLKLLHLVQNHFQNQSKKSGNWWIQFHLIIVIIRFYSCFPKGSFLISFLLLFHLVEVDDQNKYIGDPAFDFCEPYGRVLVYSFKGKSPVFENFTQLLRRKD